MKELYDIAIKLMRELMLKHECAMVICQAIGFNGFKRWHRHRSKKFMCWGIGLANELFDNYRKSAAFTSMPGAYTASSLQEHLASWDSCLEKAIQEFADLSKQFLEKTGQLNCFIEKALCCLQKDREKTRRWFTRFQESNWSSHDMHYVDDALHEKEKKKEKKEHARKAHDPY